MPPRTDVVLGASLSTYAALRSQKSSSCDAVVFRERPLDIVCLTVWNGTHATLGKLGSKGSLVHAFTVRIRTGNQNQKRFYPSVQHEISVLVELILGHLRYLLTDMPPQPNSPPDNVFRPDRPAE
ncbi:Regulator of rDNA transcription protein 15 [Capsicum baccatum]|uniref:Regulator of rDNA transcription protein 15 n=1 Tax=Capsicum baccatum TaxID=33114 RepID=A0A2G2V102_CAPBA|nr:Regulator of rDNA transcription protein 15 [Capsicum baccatum]